MGDFSLVARQYRECGPVVYGYLRRRLGDGDLAADLLQETFVHVLRRPELLAGADSPRAWLLSIARNLSSNALRDRRRTAALPEQLAAASSEADPRLERMRQAVAALPEGPREALLLRLDEELSYAEIATVLGIPIGTVRSRLHEAVRLLRERLAPQ